MNLKLAGGKLHKLNLKSELNLYCLGKTLEIDRYLMNTISIKVRDFQLI